MPPSKTSPSADTLIALHRMQTERDRARQANRLLLEQLAAEKQKTKALRNRVFQLEESRDLWRNRATGKRTTINRLRGRLQSMRVSRDMWRVRAMRT